MKKLFQYNGRSLSTRLSLGVVFFVTVIFVAVFIMMFSQARELVRKEAWGKATKTLDGTVLHIDNTLRKVEIAANNMLYVIEQHLDQPDKMFELSRQILQSNPELTGCSISFAPYYYKEKGRYFSAYSYNNGDSIQTEQEGTDNYQYHYMDWYLIPKLLNRPYWIEPFKEDAEEGIVVKEIFSSYSQPIHDKEGQSVGTFSVDICLDWFSETVSKAKPYPHSYCILLGKGGTFLVHPDTTKLFYETIFTRVLEKPDSMQTKLGEAMIHGESGNMEMTVGGEQCYVFFRPFKNTGWSVAIICPERDIYEGYRQLRSSVIWISLISVLSVLFFCWMVVRSRLKPLRHLVRVTRSIADGQFSAEDVSTDRPDEIGQLQRSFKTMRQSLVNYIEEVRQQTKMLEQRNKELKTASEQAKEAERMKTSVLHKMSNDIVAPVADISANTSRIFDQQQQLTDDEFAETVNLIQMDAKQVTQMLDDLLRTVQEEEHQQTMLNEMEKCEDE